MEGVSDSSSPPCSFSRCLGASSLSVEACAPPTQAARSKPVNLQTSASSCLPAHKSVDRVVLNVGGRIHETTAETLLSIPESYFSGLLSEGWRAANGACGRDDTIFVDRNGDRFAYVLDFLRDGVLLCPRDKLLLQGLRLEAKFFALEPLLSEVDRLLEQIELEQAARALRKMSVSERSCGGGQGSSAAEGSTSGFSRFSSPAKSRCIPGDGVSEPDSPPVVSVFVPPTPVVLPMHTASVFRAPKDFRMFEASLGSPACSRTSSPSGRGSLHNSTDRDGPDRSEEAQRRALINDDPEPPPTFGPGGVAGDSRICLGEKVFRTDADF